jgi:hypothetical protein
MTEWLNVTLTSPLFKWHSDQIVLGSPWPNVGAAIIKINFTFPAFKFGSGRLVWLRHIDNLAGR